MNSVKGATYKYLFDRLGNGNNYFRLKAMDNDGQSIEVQGSDVCGGSMQVYVFPNPTKEMLKY